MTEAKRAISRANRIAVLTGAGLSAESGLATFRGQGGWWKTHRVEDLATYRAYKEKPKLVWQWYAMRYKKALQAEPNSAHYALAELEKEKALKIVTQNVDGLHKRAGSMGVIELHGNLSQSRCERCKNLDTLRPEFSLPPLCSKCKAPARPHIVWFGETLAPDLLQAAFKTFSEADVVLIIGTSGLVEPAASLGRLAKQKGAFVIEINPEQTPLSLMADISLHVGASEGLDRLL